jgi:hypothetical protein
VRVGFVRMLHATLSSPRGDTSGDRRDERRRTHPTGAPLSVSTKPKHLLDYSIGCPHPSRSAPTSPKFVLGAQRASARMGEVRVRARAAHGAVVNTTPITDSNHESVYRSSATSSVPRLSLPKTSWLLFSQRFSQRKTSKGEAAAA